MLFELRVYIENTIAIKIPITNIEAMASLNIYKI